MELPSGFCSYITSILKVRFEWKNFQISDMPLTTTLVALESISSNYEGWIDFDITNSALKWVGTMEWEMIKNKSKIIIHIIRA